MQYSVWNSQCTKAWYKYNIGRKKQRGRKGKRQGKKGEGKRKGRGKGKERKKTTIRPASKQTNNGAMERWVDRWTDGSINSVNQDMHVHNNSCKYMQMWSKNRRVFLVFTHSPPKKNVRVLNLKRRRVARHRRGSKLRPREFWHCGRGCDCLCTYSSTDLAPSVAMLCAWAFSNGQLSLWQFWSQGGGKKIHKAEKGYLSCTTSRLPETLQAQFATKRQIGREPLTFTRSLLFWWTETHHGLAGASIWSFASCPWNIQQLCYERSASGGTTCK